MSNEPRPDAEPASPAPRSLRLASLRDLPEVVRIYNETIAARTATADLQPVSVESRRAWFEEHDPARYPLWVAESGAGLLGWASLQRFHPRAAYHATAELSIYVQANTRRTGLGRELLVHAVEQAPRLGLRTLLGLVFGHNAASLALFESQGFERWALLPRVAQLDDVERDLVIVGRRVA